MSGTIIRVIPRTDFDFSSLVASAVTGKVPLATGEPRPIPRSDAHPAGSHHHHDERCEVRHLRPSVRTYTRGPRRDVPRLTSALSVSSVTVVTGTPASALIEQAFAATSAQQSTSCSRSRRAIP